MNLPEGCFAENGKLIVDAPRQLLNSIMPALQTSKDELLKLLELKELITIVGVYYNATSPEVHEMLVDTLREHSLEVALLTFRESVKQLKTPNYFIN